MTTVHAALRISNLSVVFDHGGHPLRALDGIDLEVPAGQLLVIIGPSGEGKSTLLRAIAGLLVPTSGTVESYGKFVVGPSRERGMVFQEDTAFPWMRVRDNIGYGLKARRVPAEERRRVVDKYLTKVGLENFSRSWPKELSGGMRKRVAVAAAFASDPKILLMDEPFGTLDFVTRASLHTTLLELWRETGKTILFVTHDVDEALVLGDRIVVVSRGRVNDDLPAEFPRPRSDTLRAEPAAIELRHLLLARLGLGTETPSGQIA